MATPAKKSNLGDGHIVMSQNLDLHNTLGTQFGIKHSWYEEYNPINALTDSNKTYIFNITSTGNVLIHPSDCLIKFKFKVVKSSGANIDNTELVFPVNNLSSSFFKSLAIKLNNYVLENSDDLYAYRANLEKTLLYPEKVKKNGMNIGDYVFQNQSYDVIRNTINYVAMKNNSSVITDEVYLGVMKRNKNYDYTPFLNRQQKCSEGKEVTLYDVIHSDLFNQSKYLPPNSTLNLTFTRADEPAFYLLTEEATPAFKIKLLGFSILVAKSEVDSGVIAGMKETTKNKDKMVYKLPYKRCEITTHTIPVNTTDFSQVASFLKGGSIVPRRIFIAFVKHSAFLGNYKQDPFHYHDVNILSQTLRVGGQIRPYPELRCDTRRHITEDASKNDDIAEFLFSLLASTGTLYSNASLGININNWSKGNAITGYDLTSKDVDDVFAHPKKENIEFYCRTSTSDATNGYTMLIYAEYDSEFQIDEEGIVYKELYVEP